MNQMVQNQFEKKRGNQTEQYSQGKIQIRTIQTINEFAQQVDPAILLLINCLFIYYFIKTAVTFKLE